MTARRPYPTRQNGPVAKAGQGPQPPLPQGVVVAFTDGSCLRNPGPGGWCWYIDEQQWGAGGEKNSTNNRMELRAVVEVLRSTDASQPLAIALDSTLVRDTAEKYRWGWAKRGFTTTASGTPIANVDLVKELHELLRGRMVTFHHVRGHSGIHGNERADAIARGAATSIDTGRTPLTGPAR